MSVQPVNSVHDEDLWGESGVHRIGARSEGPDPAVTGLVARVVTALVEVRSGPGSEGTVAALARHAVAGDIDLAGNLLSSHHGLDYGAAERIAAAARHLGVEWAEDRCSFRHVSYGAATLEHVVRRSARECPPRLGTSRPLVVATLRGEQHTLGPAVLAEVLRGQGWRVELAVGLVPLDVLDLVRGFAPLAVGLSVSRESLLSDAEQVCQELRARRPELAVLLGGACNLAPLAERTGAVLCRDPRQAAAVLSATQLGGASSSGSGHRPKTQGFEGD